MPIFAPCEQGGCMLEEGDDMVPQVRRDWCVREGCSSCVYESGSFIRGYPALFYEIGYEGHHRVMDLDNETAANSQVYYWIITVVSNRLVGAEDLSCM